MNIGKLTYGNKDFKVTIDQFEEWNNNCPVESTDNIFEISVTDVEKNTISYVIGQVRLLLSTLDKANQYKENYQFNEASRIYEQAADICKTIHAHSASRNCYAFSAIMKEKSEKWRYISYLWFKASGSSDVDSFNYKDYNDLFHTYPTISFEKWNEYNELDKVGRALQYAAYSEDNYNGPTDSYWLYEKAMEAYERAHNYGRMIECLISATNRYIKGYNKLPDNIITKWKSILNDRDIVLEYRSTIICAFEEIYKNMNRYESSMAKFFYLEARKLEREDCLNKKQYGMAAKMILWGIFTDYNTNVYKIIAATLVMVLVVFPWLFTYAKADLSFVESIQISVNVFLGIELIKEAPSWFYILGVSEVLLSYFVLVIISTHLIAKVVKKLS